MNLALSENKISLFLFFSLFPSFFYAGNNLLSVSISSILLSIFFLSIKDNLNLKFNNLYKFFLFFLAYLIFQILPLPLGIVEILSPKLFQLNQVLDLNYFSPLSLNPYLSLKYLMVFFISFYIFLYVPILVENKKTLHRFVITIISIGLIQTVFGLLIYSSGVAQIGVYQKNFYLNSNTGFFINRNNFAFFLVIIFNLLIFYLNFYQHHVMKKVTQNKFYNLIFSDFIILRVILFIIVLGIILTKSRIGNLALLGSLVTIFLYEWRYKKKITFLIKTILIIFILDIFILSFLFGSEQLVDRYLASSFEGEQTRLSVFLFGLYQFMDFSWFGYGMGNFETIFRLNYLDYQHFYDHVHNDYIEYLGELGVMGTVILGILIFFYFSSVFQLIKLKKLSSEVQCLLLATTVAILIHSCFDFALHMPANIILVSLTYSLGLCALKKDRFKAH